MVGFVDVRNHAYSMAQHNQPSKSDAQVIDFGDEILDTKGAAAFVKVSDRTLEGFRVRGGGPLFLNPSPKIVRYLKSDLIAWLKDHRRVSTSDGGEAR
jgi:hypothetical protein